MQINLCIYVNKHLYIMYAARTQNVRGASLTKFRLELITYVSCFKTVLGNFKQFRPLE